MFAATDGYGVYELENNYVYCSYLCNYKVFDGNSGEELASMSVPVTKEYRLKEGPKVRMVLLLDEKHAESNFIERKMELL